MEATLEFYARCDVVRLGTDEDGEEIHGRSWYVIAEAPSGHRWAHYFEEVDDDQSKMRTSAEAEAAVPPRVARLLARIRAVGADPHNSPHWAPTRPVYGSPAYSPLEDAIEERMADEDADHMPRGTYLRGLWS